MTSLLAEGIPPESIVAATFNIDAGNELKERIAEAVEAHPKLGREFLGRMNACYVGTLHGYAFQLLQQHVPKFETYDVLDNHRLAAMLLRDAKRIGLKDLRGSLFKSIKAFIANFDLVQNELIPLDSLDGHFKSVLKAFLKRLEDYRLLTYGQQIEFAVRALDRPEVFEKVHSKLRHLMIDEYQDVNPAQERLIKMLAAPPVELCVVGDDDQSIYQWRGTNVENFVKFSKRYRRVDTYRIRKNRRSVPEIVKLANGFSKTIHGRLPKKMETDRLDNGAAISIWTGATEEDEAERIAETIEKMVKRGYRFRDMAILFRGWIAYPAILQALSARSIPVMPGGRTGLFKQPDAALFGRTLAFLAEIDWSDDDVTLGQLMRDYDDRFKLKRQRRVAAVRRVLKEWFDDARADVPANLVGDYHKLLRACGVDNWDLDDPIFAVRAGTLARCTSLLADFENIRRRARPDPKRRGEQIGGRDWDRDFYFNLAIYVQNWAHGAYEGYDGGDRFENDAVELTTVHTAKGLEWPIVFVASLSAKRFPSSRTGHAKDWFVSTDLFVRERYEGTENDERRLFYVAITRARDWLSLSTHDVVNTTSVPPSHFLQEVSKTWPPKSKQLPPRVRRKKVTESRDIGSLSFSELSSFAVCGHAYRLRSDLGFQAPLAQELGYGKAVHHILRNVADYARTKGQPPKRARLDAFFEKDFYLPAATKPAHRQMKKAARKLVGNFVDSYGHELVNVYAVERPFELHLPNVVVSGRADVIIRRDSEEKQEKYELDDYKVAKDKDPEPYDRQLRTYTIAALREGLDVAEANVFDLRRAVKRSVDISAEKIRATEAEVTDLAARLKARDFAPSPGPCCRDCDVRELCKYRA